MEFVNKLENISKKIKDSINERNETIKKIIKFREEIEIQQKGNTNNKQIIEANNGVKFEKYYNEILLLKDEEYKKCKEKGIELELKDLCYYGKMRDLIEGNLKYVKSLLEDDLLEIKNNGIKEIEKINF